MTPIRDYATIIFGVLAAASIVIMPMLVGAMVGIFGLSPAEAGRIASIELGTVAIATAAVAAAASRMGVIALSGLLIGALVAGNILTLFVGSDLLIPARILSGIGSGGALALMSARLAGTANPQRYFGFFFTAYLLSATCLFYAGDTIAEVGGARAIYAVLAFLGLLAFGAALISVDGAAPSVPIAADAQPAAIGAEGAQTGALMPIVMGLIAMLLFFMAVGSVWIFLGEIGAASGVERSRILSVLGNATIAGAVGALLSSIVAARFGPVRPLFAGLATLIGLTVIIMSGLSSDNFGFVALSFVFVWMFSMPYFMGMMSILDPLGRAASLSIGAQNAGQAVGPAIASIYIGAADFSGFGLFVLAMMTISALLCIYVAARARSHQASVAPA